jgi:hypothetical protein
MKCKAGGGGHGGVRPVARGGHAQHGREGERERERDAR